MQEILPTALIWGGEEDFLLCFSQCLVLLGLTYCFYFFAGFGAGFGAGAGIGRPGIAAAGSSL